MPGLKAYMHILFDLDHTLWDFEKNSSATLNELFIEFELNIELRTSSLHFIHSYKHVNQYLWHLYNQGNIDKAGMREKRFNLVFQSFGISNYQLALDLDREYIKRCPQKPGLIEDSIHVLNLLKRHYDLHIITNGFKETQYVKLSSSRIDSYFNEVIDSESAGCTKPDIRFFQYALQKIKALPSECLVIGDNLKADILGAKHAKIDQIFFNPDRTKHNEPVTFEISRLKELLPLLIST